MKFVALLGLVILTGIAHAETWRCQSGTYWSEKGKIVVIATINKDKKSGSIKVAGTTHQASYKVDGFDRRWNFGLTADGYDYSFVIRPDGGADRCQFCARPIPPTCRR